MPIDYKKYPTNWDEFSRKIRFERANNECEKCGVPNYAIIVRDGQMWDFYDDDEECNSTIWGRNGYADSKELLDNWIIPNLENGESKPTIIVLTVAHLDQMNDVCQCEQTTGIKCAIESHVLALCQRCHLLYDIERHKFNVRRSRAEKMQQPWLADWDSRF